MGALLGLALLVAAPQDDVPVAVLGHAVQKGDRIEAGDFTVEPRPAVAARDALSAEAASGMEAARNLLPGTIVRRSDIQPVQLVRRGEPVTIRIVAGPMVITAGGRALSGGGQGAPVRVVVNATSRTLDGIVDGSGSVRITTP